MDIRLTRRGRRVVPKDVLLSINAKLPGGLDQEDWALVREVFEAIKAALPDANKRPPGEVMEFVLEAIRANGAKLVEIGPSVANALPNDGN